MIGTLHSLGAMLGVMLPFGKVNLEISDGSLRTTSLQLSGKPCIARDWGTCVTAGRSNDREAVADSMSVDIPCAMFAFLGRIGLVSERGTY